MINIWDVVSQSLPTKNVLTGDQKMYKLSKFSPHPSGSTTVRKRTGKII